MGALDASSSGSKASGFWGAPGGPTSWCCEGSHERRGVVRCGRQEQLSGPGFLHVWTASEGETGAAGAKCRLTLKLKIIDRSYIKNKYLFVLHFTLYFVKLFMTVFTNVFFFYFFVKLFVHK